MIAYIRSWPYRGSDVPFIFLGGGNRENKGASAPSLFFCWGGGGHSPHFFKIINNFLIFYHVQIIRT